MSIKKMKSIYFLSLFSLYLTSSLTYAQVNTESLRVKNINNPIQHELALSLSMKGGNVTHTSYNTQYRLDMAGNRNRAFFITGWTQGYQDHTFYQNEGFVHLRGIRNLKPTLELEGFAQTEYNEFTRLNYRHLLGSGLRFYLLPNSPTTKLYLGVGFMGEFERRKDEESTSILRSTNYISYTQTLLEKVKASTITYYQPNVGDFSNYRILSENSISSPITEKISLKTTLKIRHDNKPPATIKKTDYILFSGISLNLP